PVEGTMINFAKDVADDGSEDLTESKIAEIAEEVLEDIQHGQVDEDVATVLRQRLEKVGVDLRPESLDSLAEDIENEASR
ncbi:MAG TPA: hypothetical protein VLZ78_03470, partial [Terrimesophilobacter sp.]|nr:hypothetical protein [Terrimesophilobacter sp.]